MNGNAPLVKHKGESTRKALRTNTYHKHYAFTIHKIRV